MSEEVSLERVRELTEQLRTVVVFHHESGSHPGTGWLVDHVNKMMVVVCDLLGQEPGPPTRKAVSSLSALDEAKQIVTGNRPEQYGQPEDCFALIGRLWSEWLGHKLSRPLTAQDVAALLVLFKVARAQQDSDKERPIKRDTWVDIAGYSECGSRCASSQNGEEKEAQEPATTRG